MSLVTDQFGNQGVYRKNDTLEICNPQQDGSYSPNCYFDIDILGQGTSSGLGSAVNQKPDLVSHSPNQ